MSPLLPSMHTAIASCDSQQCDVQTPPASGMAQSLVTKALQDNLVMVFSKSHCPHCLRAKRVLDAELGQSRYVVMELENRSDCAAIQDYLRQITGARTVPRVFLQGIDRTVPPVLAAILARCRITCSFQVSALGAVPRQHSCKKVAN